MTQSPSPTPGAPAPTTGAPPGPAARLALLALLAALSLLPDPGAAFPRLTYFFRDMSITFYPLRVFAARELREGRWPVWNPYIFEGSFGVPYFHVLDLVQIAWPDPATFSFLLTLQFPIAALAAFALARDMGANRAGAFAAGAVFALGGLCRSSANLYVFLQALAVAPLVLLTLRRAALRGGRWIPLAALATASGLTTLAIEFVGQAVLFGVGLALVASERRRLALLRLGLSLILGVSLAAVAVLPLLGILPETVRGAGLEDRVALGQATPPMALLQVMVPHLFGSLSDPVQYWWGGRFFSKHPYFLSLYLGPLALALAFAGLSELERRERILVASLFVLGVWFALGEVGGLAPPVLRVLRAVRYPSKAWLLPHLAVAILVGKGASALWKRRLWERFGRASLALALVPGVMLVALVSAPAAVRELVAVSDRLFEPIRLVIVWSTAITAVLCLTGAGLAAAVTRGLVGASRATVLVVTVIALDLARAHAGLNPQADPSFFTLLPELRAERLDDLDGGRVFTYPLDASPSFLRYMAGRPPGLRLSSFFLNRQLLQPFLNVVDRVRAPDDKDLTSFTPRPPELRPEDYRPENFRHLVPWMRHAGVSRVLSLDLLQHEDLRLLTRVPGGPPGIFIHVYELARPAPVRYFACRVRAVGSSDEALSMPLTEDFDLAHEVALLGRGEATCTSGLVDPRLTLPAERRYHTSSDGFGYLVERENMASGWQAEVDGRTVPVLRANGKHRAVKVPPGQHDVVLHYRAPGLRAGLLVTVMSLLATALLLACPCLADRGSGGSRPEGIPPIAPTLPLLCVECGSLLSGPVGAQQGGDGACSCPSCGASHLQKDGIVDLTRGRSVAAGYDPHYFAKLPQVEGSHFWYVHRRETILRALRRYVPDLSRRPLFDVGCGSGGLLAWLEREGIPVSGACDAYPEALRLARARLAAPLLLVDEAVPPPLAPGQAMIAFFDVLEHIDDDLGTLRWAFQTLEPGGYLVLTVPAHPFLFDEMDRLAHHRRRYRRGELLRRLETVGFEVPHLRHFMATLVPMLVCARLVGRLLPGALSDASHRRDAELSVISGMNGFLLALLRFEGAFQRICSLPVGSSLLAVARRPLSGKGAGG